MILGIMGAMPDEVDQLCAKLENVTVEPYGGVEYHKGTLAGKQVVVCCAGMGKANAAATTQVLITKFGAEKIIFSGIAGNMTSKIGIGDVVIGKTVLYHDAQLDMICQNPPFLKEYTGDATLIAAAEKACADAGVKALMGFISRSSRRAVSVRRWDAPAPTGSSTTGRPSRWAVWPARSMEGMVRLFRVPMFRFSPAHREVMSSTSAASSAMMGDAPQASTMLAQSLTVT